MPKMQSVDDILAQLRAQQYQGGSSDRVGSALTALLGGVPAGGLLGGSAPSGPATNATDLGNLLTQGVDLSSDPPTSGFDRLAGLPSAGSSSTSAAGSDAPTGMSDRGLLASFTDPLPEPSRPGKTPMAPGSTDQGTGASSAGASPLLGSTPDLGQGQPHGLLSGLGHVLATAGRGVTSYLNDTDPTSGLTGADRVHMLAASLRDDPRYRAAAADEIKDKQAYGLKRLQFNQDQADMRSFLGDASAPPVAGSTPMATGGVSPATALSSGVVGSVTSADGSHLNPPNPNATTPGAPMMGLSDRQRRGLAAIALRQGHPDQAASIMSGDVTSDSNGYLIDHKTGQVVNKLPIHQYVNGLNVDPNAADAPSFIPSYPNGIAPTDTGGVDNVKGYVGAMAAQAGATTSATEAAKAQLDLVPVPDGRGGTKMLPRSVAVMMLGGGGAGGGGGSAGAPTLGGGVTTERGGLSPRAAAVVSSLSPRGRGAPDSGGFGTAPSAADTELATGRAKTQVERESGQPKAFNGLRDQARTTDFVLDAIDNLLPKIGATTAGFGSNLAGIKGTAAHDLQASLDTVRANVGFDRLQTMRDNSPTGGALGQVSEQENKLLQSVAGSLDAGQSPDQLRSNLMGLQKQLRAIKAQRSSLYDSTYANAGGGSSSGGGYSQADMQAAARAELARRRAGR